MTERTPKPRPVLDRRIKERIDQVAPSEPLTPGLRKQQISTHAIGFIHDFTQAGDE